MPHRALVAADPAAAAGPSGAQGGAQDQGALRRRASAREPGSGERGRRGRGAREGAEGAESRRRGRARPFPGAMSNPAGFVRPISKPRLTHNSEISKSLPSVGVESRYTHAHAHAHAPTPLSAALLQRTQRQPPVAHPSAPHTAASPFASLGSRSRSRSQACVSSAACRCPNSSAPCSTRK